MRTSFYFFLGLVAVLAALEALLQLAPVNSGLRKAATSEAAPNFRFLPDQRFVHSSGWALDNARRGQINHDGYNNSANMRDGAQVLVLGDSYIESLMLDYPDTLQGRLERALGGGVYAAASSGNGLADSLQLVRELAPKLHPKNVVILLESFDISTLLDAASRGHSAFVIRDGKVGVEHNGYQESKVKALLMHSALVRYTFYSLKFPDWLSAKMASLRSHGRPVPPDANLQAEQRGLVLDYYFDQLRQLSAQYGSKVIFLIDADRDRIYKDSAQSVGWRPGDRDWILQRMRDSGFAMVDLQSSFTEDWRQRRERLDFQPVDGHWNKVAHGIATKQVLPLLVTAPSSD